MKRGGTNDPRYSYETNDFTGKICVKTEHYVSDKMLDRDKVLLEPFGFGYDKDVTVRVVIVFLRYLRKLSPEHQQIWKAHEVPGSYSLHPVYRDVALGIWYKGMSVFQAFTEELKEINLLSKLIGRPALFKNDFTGEAKPKEFSFLLRPTVKEFNSFAQLLDKMTSDNIDTAFFQGEVKMERIETDKDGSTVVRPKATTAALEEWLRARFTAADPEPVNKTFATLKRIRALRNSPSHGIKEDEFDQQYFEQQRKLIIDAYYAVMGLRMALAAHPSCADHKVPDSLLTGRIWTS